jgi:putative ABC transport system permease protein
MNVIWYKVWFDLWRNKVRTLLAILSIAVGVFAIGSIFGMVDQLLGTMDAAHQATFPSHINMFLRDRIKRETAIRLKNIPGVEDIELLNSVSTRYKRRPEDPWQAGIIAMRDDYEAQIYDIFQLKAGEWPNKNNISIERLSSSFFGIDLGDSIIFEFEGADRALPVTGKVRHPFVEPPEFGGDAVFLMDGRGLERFDIPEGEFGNLRVRVTPYSEALAKSVATEIKERLAKEEIGVAITFFQDPDEHWGRVFVEGFNLVLQILAVVSLFMSVILVTNTLTALITQQTHQIGMIKAIGGTRAVIIKTYLSGVLVYGGMALVISLPLGAMVAFGMSQWFLNVFNIDYEQFQISNRAITFQVMAALAVPLLAGLWPVLNGAAISVREAIASYGLGADFGFSRLDRLIESVGNRLLSSPYAISLGNMFRRKGRLILTQLVLVTAGAMFLLVMSLSSSLTYTLDNDIGRRGFDIRIGFDERQRIDRLLRMAGSLPGVATAEAWFSQPASLLKEGQRLKESGVGAELYGIPLGSTMYTPLIVQGRWLQSGDTRAVVISQDLAEDNNIQVGNTITLDLGELGDSDWQVAGILQVIISDGFAADPIYASRDEVFAVTKKFNEGSQLFVRTRTGDPAAIAQVNAQLKALYEERQMDLNVFLNGTTIEDRQNALNQFGIVVSMLYALATIVALVGGIGLMGSLSISVVERTREIGVMRAIGARSRTIMGMFMMEGVLQGLLSWLIAIPISVILVKPVAQRLGETMLNVTLDFKYSLSAVALWLVIVLIIATLASILPARNATQISVQQSLAYA